MLRGILGIMINNRDAEVCKSVKEGWGCYFCEDGVSN